MKVYRVSSRNFLAEHVGYEFHANKKEAVKKHKESNNNNNIDPEIREIEIKISKKGIIEALNQWASHPDNG